ncbi:hypothetical protein UPYG_G00118040 [Umbra pygmaea]|uniref:Neuronal PAS domain-containing protein 4 n=1 Tax=Umbra pygmaea TaxID=75934 RepID=A0ABD0X4D7_UMBPY
MYRSTKGASKARRDQINAEIRNLRELLPISDTDKARLSYLHIMSLACMYARKSVFFSQDVRQDETTDFISSHELSGLINELSGFILLVTSDGKLLYLSDNVIDHLGHCMVDLVAQSDSVYDIIDPMDHFIMRSSLAGLPTATTDKDRLFRCRFNTTKFIRRKGTRNQLMLVRARCLTPLGPVLKDWISNPVWVLFCTPLRTNTANLPVAGGAPLTPPPEKSFLLPCFHSQHHRDMRLWDAEDSVSVYLGYDIKSLRSRSWYSLVHPRDLSHACEQHNILLSGGDQQVEAVLQVEAADHSWVWLYMILQVNLEEPPVSSNNYVISESEAWSIRQQLSLEKNQFPGYLGSGESLSSPDQAFTPSSSGLSAQSFDFSMALPDGSSCQETMQPGGSGSGFSLSSLEEENNNSGEQNQWKSNTSNLFVGPTVYPTASLTDFESDIQTQRITSDLNIRSAPRPPSLSKPVAPLSLPQPQQMGDFACTPPYTPHLLGGSFPFGEKLAQSLDVPLSCPLNTTCPSLAHNALASEYPRCFFPMVTHRKLSHATYSSGLNECSVMDLPHIRGPLYVDVPQMPFRGLLNELTLTPDASPTHPPCTFFSTDRDQEREKEDISLLAKYISSVAEGFDYDPVLPRVTTSLFQTTSSLQATSQNNLFGGECQSNRAPDPGICQDDAILSEDSMLLQNLIKELRSFPLSSRSHSSSSSCNSSPLCSPLPPTSGCKPSFFKGETSLSVNHACSVQLTQCNCMAVGGAMMDIRAETRGETTDSRESEMDIEMPAEPQSSQTSPAVNLTDFQECGPALVQPTPIIGLPHNQSLLEELGAMEPLFEADASFTPSWGNNLSCINSQSTVHSQSFYQDGSLRDPAF